MKDSVAPGIAHEMTVTITPEMGVTHMGSGPGVLSTPNMIQKMEQTCLEGVEPHLDGSEQTVGTMVHIWHRAPVSVGDEVRYTCKLIERDRKRLLFEVEATSEGRVIGDGTHERFVIDMDRFGG